MKKILGAVLLLLVTGSVIVYLALFFGERWINAHLASILNANPKRTYDISFDRVEYDILKRIILVHEVRIRLVGKPTGVYAEGKVHQASLSHVDAKALFLDKVIDIQELRFLEPRFDIFIPDHPSSEEQTGEAFQSLFGDLLSRGEIRNFLFAKANSTIYKGEKVVGQVSNLSISALHLSTDSLLWTSPIPFEYGRIRMSVDSLEYHLANGQHLKVGKVNFDTQPQQLKVHEIYLRFPEGLEAASSKLEFQTDLVEIHLDSLIFSGLDAGSNFYSDLDIRARKAELVGLDMRDFRNKTKPRPKNQVKPMFQGMIQKISFPLKLDTLLIQHSNIRYGENVPEKGESWDIHFDDLRGAIFHLTTIPEYQNQFSGFHADFTGKIEGKGNLKLNLEVPYDKDEFRLKVDFRNFSMTELNSILKPIMNGDIVSGNMDRLNLDIHAGTSQSKVKMIFDYTDLKIELFKKGTTKKKNKLLSSLANLALNHSNMPSEKRYISPSYTVKTNPYRGPFFLIWQSTKEGMMQIVPGGAVREILMSNEK